MFDFNNDADDETEPEEQPEVPEPENEPAEETDGPEPAELDARIDDVADDVERTRSSVRTLESSQEELADSIEDVHDTVRELAGLYDRVQAAENPFVDDPGHVRAEEPHDGAHDDGGGNEDEVVSESDAEDVVSFDDLASEGDEPEPPKAETEPEPPKSDREPEPPNAEAEPAPPKSEPILASVPDGYAGDALAMEWLAGLMEQSGPAGALRAVEHYESSGWISTEVRDHLVDLVAGPDLDVFVDPMQPREPTAAEHVESGAYLRALAAL